MSYCIRYFSKVWQTVDRHPPTLSRYQPSVPDNVEEEVTHDRQNMASRSFRESMNSLGWTRRDPDIPVRTSSTTPFLSRLQSLNPFSSGEGYVRLPTHEAPGAPLPAPSRREEEESFFACEFKAFPRPDSCDLVGWYASKEWVGRCSSGDNPQVPASFRLSHALEVHCLAFMTAARHFAF